MFQVTHSCNTESRGIPIVVKEQKTYEIQGMFHVEDVYTVKLKCNMCNEIENLPVNKLEEDTDGSTTTRLSEGR